MDSDATVIGFVVVMLAAVVICYLVAVWPTHHYGFRADRQGEEE